MDGLLHIPPFPLWSVGSFSSVVYVLDKLINNQRKKCNHPGHWHQSLRMVKAVLYLQSISVSEIKIDNIRGNSLYDKWYTILFISNLQFWWHVFKCSKNVNNAVTSFYVHVDQIASCQKLTCTLISVCRHFITDVTECYVIIHFMYIYISVPSV